MQEIKWGVMDASRKATNAPAHAFAMEIVRQTQTMVNELSMLCINFHLVMNTC
jgi:hypothetical protein